MQAQSCSLPSPLPYIQFLYQASVWPSALHGSGAQAQRHRPSSKYLSTRCSQTLLIGMGDFWKQKVVGL